MDADQRSALRQRARTVLEANARAQLRPSDFGVDHDWLNVSRPLSSARDLAGKLVLLDFWTYGCINCVHVAADLAFLEERYRGEPFVVVGCHSAKFANERGLERVRDAVLRARIEHPVVLDREFAIWKRFGVRAWPTLVLLAPDGVILGQVSGEGQRAVLDVMIEVALELYHARPGAFDRTPLPLWPESGRDWPRELRFPGKVCADAARGRLWVADTGHHRVLELELDGRFVRQFGGARAGFADGAAGQARFANPQGLALDGQRLLVADTGNHAIRAADLASGSVATLAGTGRQGYERRSALAAAQAALDSPFDVHVVAGRILVAMAGSHQIWELDERAREVRPLAGDGAEELRDGAFERAAFAQPSGLAAHGARVFVADSESSSIRALELASKRVTTLAGGAREPRNLFHFGDEDGSGPGRRLQHPLGVAADPLCEPARLLVYVADTYNHKVKLLDPDSGALATYAGSGAAGWADGEAETARFCEPGGLALCDGRLFVADTGNHALRAIDLESHVVTTLALRGVPIPEPLPELALDTHPLPRFPSTVVHPQTKRRLAPGDARLSIDVELAPGESFAPGAPSQYRVLREAGLVAAKSVAGPIISSSTDVALGVAGSGLLLVQALLYLRDARSRCSLRSHAWSLEIEEHARAPRELRLAAGPSNGTGP